jgi:hypothetical protein
MRGHGDERAAGDPARGSSRAPPVGPDAPLRRAVRWLFADREEIDQEGLLAERTLLVVHRRRAPAEDQAPDAPERRGADR